MGQYYTEDDWCLEFVEETREDIIAAAGRKVAFSDIRIADATLEKVPYLQYREYKLVLEGSDKWGDRCTDHETLEPGNIVQEIEATPLYKEALAEKELAIEERERKEKMEAGERRKEKELAMLARLKAKYEVIESA